MGRQGTDCGKIRRTSPQSCVCIVLTTCYAPGTKLTQHALFSLLLGKREKVLKEGG